MKLKGNLKLSWELRGYSDADYAGDNDAHKIVIRLVVLINGFFAACLL